MKINNSYLFYETLQGLHRTNNNETESTVAANLSKAIYNLTMRNTDKDITPSSVHATDKTVNFSGREIDYEKMRGASVSISQETMEVIFSEEGFKKMQKDFEEMIFNSPYFYKELTMTKENENDPFWDNTRNQWLIFAENLYNNNFFDSMSADEVEETTTLLAKITSSMDYISRRQFGFNLESNSKLYSGNLLDSEGAKLELESAVAALRYFGDKYVKPENQEEYNTLVDNFYSHNSDIIKDYRSPIEGMYRFANSVASGQYPNSSLLDVRNEALRNQSRWKVSVYLGGITHTSTEDEQYREDLQLFFKKMQEKGVDNKSLWEQLKSDVVDYATRNRDDKDIRNHVMEQMQKTFDRIEDYWSELLI